MVDDSPSDRAQMDREFHREERALRVRLARLGAWLAIPLTMAGTGLDWFLYEEQFSYFFILRLFCTALLCLVAWLLYSRHAERFGLMLAYLLGLLPAFMVCAMILVCDGSACRYWAGLVVIILAVTLLMQSWREALTFVLLVASSYLLVCETHEKWMAPGAGPRVAPPVAAADDRTSAARIDFILNLGILVMTSTVCVAVCENNARLRRTAFDHRFNVEKQRQALAELDQMKSQFFANISHELRTPLTLILGPVDTLIHHRPPLPQSVGQQLQMVRRNGLRLASLINDLLDLVRMEQSRLELHCRPLALSDILRDVVDSMRDAAESNGLALTLAIAAPDDTINADEARLERVFINLLSNAIKFTPEGGRIEVRLDRCDGTVCVEVRDTGRGIPAEEVPRIFERYYQVKDSSARTRQGLGIGLHLARELVEAHGGSITASSHVGRGTTVRVQLPLIGTPAEEPARPQPDEQPRVERPLAAVECSGGSAGSAAEMLAESPHRPAVLVVDDEPDMRQYLVSILQDKHRVFSASTAERGIQMAEEISPDVVVLDLMLPGMDGLEACGVLRSGEMPPDMKIIMLTARLDEGTKIAALRSGVDDFLNKPFNSIEVQLRVTRLLETSQLQGTLRTRNRELEATLQQLRQTEAQLVQSEKMNALGSLAAGLLHEINNPLNYTLVAVQMAERKARGNAELAENLRDIREGLKRVSNIITDLRAFAYPDQAALHKPFPAADAISTAKRFTSHSLHGVELNLPQGELPSVFGSVTQISQVLVNLISNAVDATREVEDQRQPRIDIEAEKNHDRLIFRVRDNGSGVPSAIISRIFDPFFTTKSEGKGTGLGLSVCHTIVRNHRGELTVSSEPGTGTVFSFAIPLAEARNGNHERQ